MLEIEMKFPAPDAADLQRRLAALGAEPGEPRDEVDHYFNAPDRDFARTDEALRLRRVGEANFVTYKGPKRDTQTKTRTELELPIGTGDAMAADFERLLTLLGYRSVALVRKRRRPYHLRRDRFELEITLDEVQGLGLFSEIEIQAPEEDLEPARKVLLETATDLGLQNSERRSYLELLLTKAKA